MKIIDWIILPHVPHYWWEMFTLVERRREKEPLNVKLENRKKIIQIKTNRSLHEQK